MIQFLSLAVSAITGKVADGAGGNRLRRTRWLPIVALLTLGAVPTGCSGTTDVSIPDQVSGTTEQPAHLVELSEALRSGGASTKAGLIEERGSVWIDGDPMTLLAPSDEAFSSLDADALASVLANEVQLNELLALQTLDGRITMDQLVADGALALPDGSVVPVAAGSPGVTIGDAVVLESDLEAGTVIVHVVDRFLAPVTDERITG